MKLTCWTASDGSVWIEERISECETEVYAKVTPAHADMATLFAAVPDLLAALTAMINEADHARLDPLHPIMVQAENARAALAEASGSESVA